ncbi:MAG: oligosaccharide flippase family protein [Chloroflexi bacterium]|nr:oligosaccharide flippase family protein [Chloroflexota bacterium]
MATRLRRLLGGNTSIILNAGSIVGTNAVTSILGFAYWWVAAREYAAASVGFSAAAISAMMLLGYLSMLGLGTLLIRELPRQPGKESSLIITAVLASAMAGIAIGLLFVAASPWISPEFGSIEMSMVSSCLFAAGVSLTGMGLVLDQALIGLLRGELQLWRNTLFAVSKLIILIGAGLWWQDKSWLAIYLTWLLGNLLSMVVLIRIVTRSGEKTGTLRLQWGILRGLGRTAVAHHALNLSSQAPSLILPVIVTIVLSSKANAYFYMSWMVSSFVFVGTASLATALYAVGARALDAMAQKTRFTLGLSLLAASVAGGMLVAGADWILRLFGGEYAQEAATSLRILVLAAFPLGVKAHYAVIWRIRGNLMRPILWVVTGAALELILAVIGANVAGLTGLSMGWVGATWIEAACMWRTVQRVAFPRDTLGLRDLSGAESLEATTIRE